MVGELCKGTQVMKETRKRGFSYREHRVPYISHEFNHGDVHFGWSAPGCGYSVLSEERRRVLKRVYGFTPRCHAVPHAGPLFIAEDRSSRQFGLMCVWRVERRLVRHEQTGWLPAREYAMWRTSQRFLDIESRPGHG
jgi:hypothetical protein